MKKMLVLLLVLGLAGTASALTADDVEAAVEASVGAAAISTYLDFTDSATGDTREGLTISQGPATSDNWNYPDGSNSSMFVNENSLDDKFAGSSDFEVTITGLTANTSYGVFYCAKGKPGVTSGDFSWGLDASGAATQLVKAVSSMPGAVDLAENGGDHNYAVPLVQVTSDATGTLKMWVGNGDDYDLGEDSRTQIDGLVIGEGLEIPEPMTMTLLGLGGLALIRRKR